MRKNLTIEKISRTIRDCVDRLAPERYASYKKSPSKDWINNRIEIAITKETFCSSNGLTIRKKSQEIYRLQRNVVTFFVSNAKRSCKYQKLGTNPTAKNIDRTVKTHLAKKQG